MVGTQWIASHWWVLLIRGLVAVAFGIFAFVYPVATIAAFVLLFGAFALVDGVFVTIAALRLRHPQHGERWWLMLLQGLAGIAVGLVTFFWPGITALALALLIAAWAILTGFLEIGAAFQLRKQIAGEIFLVIAGALSVLLGLVFAIFPTLTLLFSVYFFGAYAIVAGIALVVLSFRMRSLHAPTA
jgi:uncharacterized membrane protein HdeD (DUF308 family)